MNCFLNYENLSKRKDIDYNLYTELQDEELLFDETYLDLIVNNLLSNAFKYTEKGECITVRLYKEDNNLVLQVIDTGVGIPAEKQKRYENQCDKTIYRIVAKHACCRNENGVCAKCYGINLAVGHPVNPGEAVGVIAAQSIGEPGTQLTMRTFHTGGIAGDDITQGLPRVEELFESRRPKNAAIIARVGGKVRYEKIKKQNNIIITQEDGTEEAYPISYALRPRVYEGDTVNVGDPLTIGSFNPHDVLEVLGEEAVQNYIIAEVQKVYRMQGVDINDKHIEVIVRQMMRKIRITDPGDSYLLPGSIIGKNELTQVCEEIQQRIDNGEVGLRMPQSEAVLLGITKASLATDSFLSAASFQETTRVLTDAAIRGKEDPLLGLKENVIIGKLIPAGTGLYAEEREAEKEALAAAEAAAENASEDNVG